MNNDQIPYKCRSDGCGKGFKSSLWWPAAIWTEYCLLWALCGVMQNSKKQTKRRRIPGAPQQPLSLTQHWEVRAALLTVHALNFVNVLHYWVCCTMKGVSHFNNAIWKLQVLKEVTWLLKAKFKNLHRPGEKTGGVWDMAAGGPYLLSDPWGWTGWHVPSGKTGLKGHMWC